MQNKERITQLERELVAAEATIASLLEGQVDAIIEPQTASPLMLRQAQNALLKSEQKLRAVFETALEAMVIADDDGVYLDANPAAEELFGVSREQIVGHRVSDFLAEDRSFATRWGQFRRRESERGQIAVRRPDGEVRYAEYSAVANFLPGQNLSVMRDVTERLQMEQVLRTSEERYRSLFANAAVAIALHRVIYDRHGMQDDGEADTGAPGGGMPVDLEWLDVNPAAEELLGRSREELVGRRFSDVFRGIAQDILSMVGRVARTGQTIRFERYVDVVEKYLDVSAFISSPGRVAFLITDITARRQAEKERQETLYQLRERVKELTLLHRAGQLFSVSKMAVPDLLHSIVNLIPPAWQYPELAMARIRYGDLTTTTEAFMETSWVQRATFTVPGGHNGMIEVFYREERPHEVEGLFLAEERAALDALTSMLQADLERRHASEALQHSEERYRTLFETMAQGVIYQDTRGRIIDINPAARRILDLVDVDLTTTSITDHDLNLVRGDGSRLPREQRPGRKAIRTGEPVLGEVVGLYVPAEDAYHWIVVNAIPQFRHGRDEPCQVYSTLTDITERRRMEERRAQLATLVESSHDAIIGVDFEGVITSWNLGAQTVFGYTAEEAVGEHFSMIAPPEFGSQQQSVVDSVARGEAVENYGTVRLTKDGKRIFVSFSISPILDSTGKAVGVAGIARDVTVQKRAEARLRFQAQLLDSVDEAVIALDLDDRIIYWGKGAEALYGYTREETLGRTLDQVNLIPEDMSADTLRQQRETVLEEGAWRGILRQQDKNGSYLWVRISLSAVRDSQGQIVGYIGIDRDVSAERYYERELKTIAAVADWLRTSDSIQNMFETVFPQLQNHLAIEMGVVVLLDADRERLHVAFVSGLQETFESRVFDSEDGITRTVIEQRKPFKSDDIRSEDGYRGPTAPERLAASCIPLVVGGEAIGAMWVMRDVAFADAEMRLLANVADILASAVRRMQLYEQLQEQAYRVQRITDTVEDGLILLDREARVILANPSATEYLAVLGAADDSDGAEDVVGRRLERLGDRSLLSLLGAPYGTEHLVAAAAGGAKGDDRVPYNNRSAARREFHAAAHPVLEEGQKRGWVLVLRDVTERRRTQEMVQQQERLAAVGQLAAGIAHDFNNVMSAIVLYAQILQRRDDLSDKERRRLDVIYRQANHAIDLIKQILDFSRRSVMERSAMDLVPFFKEMFRLFEHTLPESIELALHYEASDYFVVADPTRLQQAIMNLAINARDAMPDGGSFTVRLSRLVLAPREVQPSPDMAPGAWLRIDVADNGCGMSEEMMQHLFEPFYTTKGPGKGTGLGLAQVYGIIRQHDGAITVDSVQGRGTTFTIYLPLIEEELEADEEPSPSFAQAVSAPREATILLVEDEASARVAVEESLQALGYHVLAAANGQEALAIFAEKKRHIDLVLSDMVMPEMGGLVLYEQIQAQRPQMKMIIMSGYPLQDAGRSLLERGAVDWIAKPFSVNDLAQKVADMIANG